MQTHACLGRLYYIHIIGILKVLSKFSKYKLDRFSFKVILSSTLKKRIVHGYLPGNVTVQRGSCIRDFMDISNLDPLNIREIIDYLCTC